MGNQHPGEKAEGTLALHRHIPHFYKKVWRGNRCNSLAMQGIWHGCGLYAQGMILLTNQTGLPQGLICMLEKDKKTTIVMQQVDLDPLDPNIFTKAWLESKSR